MSHHHKGPKEERGPQEATLPATLPTPTSNSSQNTTGSRLFSHEALVAHLSSVIVDLKVDYPILLDLLCGRVSQCIDQIKTNPENKRTIYQNLDQLADYLDEVVDYHRYIRDRLRDFRTHFLTVSKLDGESLSNIIMD